MPRRIAAALVLAALALGPTGCTRIIDKDTPACAEYRSVKAQADDARLAGQEPPAAERLARTAEACTESNPPPGS